MAQKKSTVSYLTKKVIVNRSLSWLANLTNNKISPAIPSLSANNRKGMNGPINYLAIGDSMAAGYNPNYGGVDLIGSFDSDKKKITGSSYPAYFANYLNQSSQLASFHNHATTGSQITDWLVFLGVNEVDQQTQKSLTKLVANLKLNAHHNNPYQTIINSLFQVSGDGSQQIIACPSLIKFIQQANLITISLGANDFINAFETWFQ